MPAKPQSQSKATSNAWSDHFRRVQGGLVRTATADRGASLSQPITSRPGPFVPCSPYAKATVCISHVPRSLNSSSYRDKGLVEGWVVRIQVLLFFLTGLRFNTKATQLIDATRSRSHFLISRFLPVSKCSFTTLFNFHSASFDHYWNWGVLHHIKVDQN